MPDVNDDASLESAPSLRDPLLIDVLVDEYVHVRDSGLMRLDDGNEAHRLVEAPLSPLAPHVGAKLCPNPTDVLEGTHTLGNDFRVECQSHELVQSVGASLSSYRLAYSARLSRTAFSAVPRFALETYELESIDSLVVDAPRHAPPPTLVSIALRRIK
jgi:hypothetical protein